MLLIMSLCYFLSSFLHFETTLSTSSPPLPPLIKQKKTNPKGEEEEEEEEEVLASFLSFFGESSCAPSFSKISPLWLGEQPENTKEKIQNMSMLYEGINYPL
jgi:hypothetical protein